MSRYTCIGIKNIPPPAVRLTISSRDPLLLRSTKTSWRILPNVPTFRGLLQTHLGTYQSITNHVCGNAAGAATLLFLKPYFAYLFSTLASPWHQSYNTQRVRTIHLPKSMSISGFSTFRKTLNGQSIRSLHRCFAIRNRIVWLMVWCTQSASSLWYKCTENLFQSFISFSDKVYRSQLFVFRTTVHTNAFCTYMSTLCSLRLAYPFANVTRYELIKKIIVRIWTPRITNSVFMVNYNNIFD